MKTYTIDEDNNIMAWGSRTTALFQTPGGFQAFGTPEELATLAGGKRLVEVWNSFTGVTPVKKFTTALVGAKRIFSKIQSLEVSPEDATATTETPEEPAGPAPTSAKGAKKKARAVKAARKDGKRASTPKAAQDASDGPRVGSKTETVVALMKQPGGATLQAIRDATQWQPHSVRGFISGTLGKKMGLTVVSTKGENGERTYSIGA